MTNSKDRDATQAESGPECDERTELDILARLRTSNGSASNIVVVNVSRWGFQAMSSKPPAVGMVVNILIGGVKSYPGIVRWHQQGKFGVQAFEAIDVETLV